LNCEVKKTNGVHALWLRFYGADSDLFDLDSFKFTKLGQ
jgi:hypothetical protein